jgi:hypothetical protein
MVLIYPVVALMVGLVSCVLLWPYGAAIALISMPFIGSMFALLVAMLVYMRGSDKTPLIKDRAMDTDQFKQLRLADRHQ